VQFAVAGSGGTFGPDEVSARVHAAAYYYPRTSLVCIENTHNRAGGRVFPQERVRAVAELARARGFGLHLDGARLWNASAATGLSVAELGAPFDTVSVCFSKGLGAPVGSALCASRETVERARRLRKMWGGGMRQSGILAAGALHALRHHRARLAEDHENARRFAGLVAAAEGIVVDVAQVETNIVNVETAGARAEEVAAAARELGLLLNPTGPERLRAVMHLDVKREDLAVAAQRLAAARARVASAGRPR
jgi:threonine aldolase